MPVMDDAHSKAESASPALGADFELAVRTLITEIGEDPERQGLIGTPARVRRMYGELTDGYRADPDALINNACYDVEYDEMVVVRDIEFFSLCEHHLLPFYGHAHVGYLPRGRVIGLSKIPRIVDLYAHRLQVQERLTQQVAELLMERLNPKGVACVVEATHLCTMMRGVRKQRATMVTSAMLGTFRRDPKTRGEFLTFIGRPTSLGA
jgi:GTP cyclohydrolase IA